MFSTIQIGITLVGILTCLYSGATFSGPLEEILVANIPSIEPYAASISSFIIVAIITYLSLVIGELVPKRLALNSPESIAVVVSKPIYWLSVALKPIVSFLGVSTEFLLKLLGVTVKEEAPVTESEINKMLTEGVAMGAYEEEEPILVENIFHLADMNAGDIMTPRTQLKWIDLNGTEDEIMEVLKNANHYRIPVGTDSLDELKGLVTVSDVLVQIMQRNPGMKVKIESHTDNKGSDAYNLKLSDERARSTMQYVISKGINGSRLQARGYGESVPKVDCGTGCTPEQDAMNRRSEFIITQE